MNKVVFMCDGQGAVKLNAGKERYEQDPVFREAFDEVGSYLEVDNKSLSWGRLAGRVKTDPHLSHAYAISHQYALFSTLKHKGMTCDIITGHSLGEIIAAILAGLVPLDQGVKWVETRGKLFKENAQQVPSDMVVLRGDIEKIRNLVKEFSEKGEVYIANCNSPSQVVVAIGKDSIGELFQFALQRKIDPIPLNIKNGCHSKFVSSIHKPLKDLVMELNFLQSDMKLYSGSKGMFLSESEVLKNHFSEHLLEPVDWLGSMKNLTSMGSHEYVEIGNSKILKGLMTEIDRQVSVKTVAECLLSTDAQCGEAA